MMQQKNHHRYGYQLWIPRAVGANNATVNKVSAEVSNNELTTDFRKTSWETRI